MKKHPDNSGRRGFFGAKIFSYQVDYKVFAWCLILGVAR